MAFRFEHLDIWKDSIIYSKKVYKLSKSFPRHEMFALTNQLRRAVNSISTNIAEGTGSSSKKDFSHFLDIAIKSTFETVSLLYLAEQENYIKEIERLKLYEEAEILVKKIQAFKRSLL
jgi:four helix bundle protein